MSSYKQIRDFRDSKRVNSISIGAQNFFVRCFMEADDFGVLRGQPMLLRSLLWPDEECIQYEPGGPKIILNAALVIKWMRECVQVGIMYAYKIDEKPYIHIINFGQKGLTHPKSKYPLPTSSQSFPTFPDISQSAPEIEVEVEVEVEVETEEERELKIAEANLIVKIIECLNFVSGSSYKTKSKATAKHITARLRENFTFDQFEAVIIYKQAEWGKDKYWQKFLRPETLFGNKFEGYLQAALRETNQTIISDSEQIKQRILKKMNDELTYNQ